MSLSLNEEIPDQIKVLILDHHTSFAEGTVSLLAVEPRITVVGVAKNENECLEFVNTADPDVVLLDSCSLKLSRTDFIGRMKQINSHLKVIILTDLNPAAFILTYGDKGVAGFLLKDCSVREMIQAIFRVYEGETVFSEGLETSPRSLINNNNFKVPLVANKSMFQLFTSREVEVARLMNKGLQNKEIAAALGIKKRTVDLHIRNIQKKLKVTTRLEAVVKWAYIDL
ncbi:two component transcriptional regulator, LuxR family [Syntrophobotulus glycolicus DSM 8271]|uniref:Stage 0 sporulation protein A homolog n=1 Tax=Syntrophobotulus glycolicus (strain DSM 8271 / FlGlyR) TaxID=645991 RepID=F0SXT1_SYNGF|nr:response regulator transcription factor [Syntrophobotulus glycolicus]ADY56992.1 two component transcriptional regulator, LuxR family [Syntrophobotulus glycolicus DSM 8271]